MANSVNPDQTAPIGAVCSRSTLFASILDSSVMLGNYLLQTASADNIFRCIFFSLRVLHNFFIFLSSADFFQNQLFQKLLSGKPSKCQTVWIQIRPDILSGLIWVQTVCKGYQQAALVGSKLTIQTVFDFFSASSFLL